MTEDPLYDPVRAKLWRRDVARERRQRRVARWRTLPADQRRTRVAGFWREQRLKCARRQAAAVGLSVKHVSDAPLIRCLELPGRFWFHRQTLIRDLALDCSGSHVSSAMTRGYAVSGLHFYRGPVPTVAFSPAKTRPVMNVDTGGTYHTIIDAVQAMVGIRDLEKDECHRTYMAIHRSCNDARGQKTAAGSRWCYIGQPSIPEADRFRAKECAA